MMHDRPHHARFVVGSWMVGLLVWLVGSVPVRAADPEPTVRRFALVVGTNATADDSQAPLRFADDDAAKVSELLLDAGVDVELCTTFDRDSQALFPTLVDRARRPTPKGLQEAFDGLADRMQDAKARGAAVELLVFYSGHGDVGPDGQGYLTLEDGKLSRADLFAGLLDRSPADHNHVVLDACRSEQFVLSRGGDWKDDRTTVDASQAVRRYLDRTHLGGHPNTGVMVAHSADQQTHEWERYRGGIFTHELLSGLRGGADLNGDGAIEYSELGAFVAAANSGVTDPRARLQVVVRPPTGDERHPMLVHRDLATRRVILFTAADGHLYTIEDARGVRLADLRRSGEGPAYLRVPAGDLFVQREVDGVIEETRIDADRRGVILASMLAFGPSQGASRGSLDVAFRRGLFSTPYGRGYYNGYTDRTGLLGVDDPTWRADLWPTASTRIAETTPFGAAPTRRIVEDEDDDEEQVEPRWAWGGLFIGTSITPFDADGRIRLGPKRVTSDRFAGCLAPSVSTDDCSPVRGFDARWQFFWLRKGRPYPRWQFYVRTGYTAGHAEFEGENGGFVAGDATSLSYFTVPLFVGGNVYAFDRFPVRPFGGLGFGVDVLRVRYARFDDDVMTDVSGRVGFELHAGVEGRITNAFAITAEVMQLWSARRKLDGVPDFSNEGLTVVLGIAFGFPLSNRPTPGVQRSKSTTTPRVLEAARPEPEPAPPIEPAPSERPPIEPDSAPSHPPASAEDPPLTAPSPPSGVSPTTMGTIRTPGAPHRRPSSTAMLPSSPW